MLSIWLSDGYPATYSYPGLSGYTWYPGYTHIQPVGYTHIQPVGYTHMCYPGYTWLSLVYTFIVTIGYRLDMVILATNCYSRLQQAIQGTHGYKLYLKLCRVATSGYCILV